MSVTAGRSAWATRYIFDRPCSSNRDCDEQSKVRGVTLMAKLEPVDIDLAQTTLIVIDMQNAFASR